ETLDLKLGKVAQPLRVAISGGAISPPIDVTLELVGRERVLNRVDMALKFIEQRVAAQG
ncbi:MAG: glutamate--tRNA ligase, partial [Victivallales bacterium]|nr:glutamate--tRNA ligase [Victivallales bacterium]